MSCSPHLDGITDPLEVLRVVSQHHILRWSEPPTTFYPLAELGWVEYIGGGWGITDAGREALLESPSDEPSTEMSLTEFFDL